MTVPGTWTNMLGSVAVTFAVAIPARATASGVRMTSTGADGDPEAEEEAGEGLTALAGLGDVADEAAGPEAGVLLPAASSPNALARSLAAVWRVSPRSERASVDGRERPEAEPAPTR
jgi:hypothetical protein